MNAVGLQARWWYLHGTLPGDFVIYWNAASGQYDTGWLYKNWIAFIFQPFHLVEPFRAYLYWCGFQTACFMLLAHKLFEVQYGWILVSIATPYAADLIQVGNIQVFLCLVACYPLPALLSVLVKPHYCIYPVLHAITARYRLRDESRKRAHKN
jgi:hypothetical protein